MTDIHRYELANRADLLKEIVASLRQSLGFHLRQRDWPKATEVRRRLREAENRLTYVTASLCDV